MKARGGDEVTLNCASNLIARRRWVVDATLRLQYSRNDPEPLR
jgi:hypothetical protein